MVKRISFVVLLLASSISKAQLNPAITSFLQNTTVTGTYYMSGNSTAISNGILVNCQLVEYSTDNVYIHTKGIPAYPTGPFLDGNPSQASDQNAIFKFPLNPVPNTGTPTATTAGNIGVFINGVALFDYRDGVAWNPNTNALCGGPGGAMCPGGMGATQAWNRDAIPAEMDGFDCSKAHPANGNYHHHQNPSAFKWDLNTVSNICNLYDGDGLYTIDSTQHSPLIGFAYDGFPIYGAYGFADTNGTGGIVRIKSSYRLKTSRGAGTVPSTTTWPLGYFREDYEYIAHPGQTDYLDEHNGRFCVTPEYPNGIYCYFATVDANWNSAYPYVVGPTFYGVRANRKVTMVSEPTTVYSLTTGISESNLNNVDATIFPNPSNDFIAIQVKGLNKENLKIELLDVTGRLVQSTTINAGATNSFLDTRSLYAGNYFVKISGANASSSHNIVITK